MRLVRLAPLLTTAVFACEGGTDPIGDEVASSLVIVNAPVEMFDTERVRLAARVADATGHLLETTVTWNTLTPTTATVDDSGWATALVPGAATIEARRGDLRDTARITVLERIGFVFPVVGLPNRDFFLQNYVDVDPTVSISDYWCGHKSYDGHRGTDITIASLAVMDSGVSIVAAAAGVVTEVRDGLYDRNTAGAGGGLGNYAGIEHRDGFTSYYGHMVNGSVRVVVGQKVAAGTPLGLIGSSGNSDVPHLHFQVQRGGATVDPYQGACGATFTQWADPPGYQDSFLLITSGLTNQDLNLDLVKEPPPHVSVFQRTKGRVSMWVELFNVRSGGESVWQLYDPSNELHCEYTYTHDRPLSISWWWFWQEISGTLNEPGAWRVDYRNDGRLLAQHTFTLEGTAAAAAPAGTGPRFGLGGGGALGDPVVPG